MQSGFIGKDRAEIVTNTYILSGLMHNSHLHKAGMLLLIVKFYTTNTS